jgi:hypothetical protein
MGKRRYAEYHQHAQRLGICGNTGRRQKNIYYIATDKQRPLNANHQGNARVFIIAGGIWQNSAGPWRHNYLSPVLRWELPILSDASL